MAMVALPALTVFEKGMNWCTKFFGHVYKLRGEIRNTSLLLLSVEQNGDLTDFELCPFDVS